MSTKWRKRLRWSIIIFFLVLFLIYYIPRAYRGTVEVTIIDKERITFQEDGQTKSKYLVYTDEEVFENTDEPFYLKFNSSDVYGMLKVNEKYELSISGWRIKVFSAYRNIISAERMVDLPEELKQEEEPKEVPDSFHEKQVQPKPLDVEPRPEIIPEEQPNEEIEVDTATYMEI